MHLLNGLHFLVAAATAAVAAAVIAVAGIAWQVVRLAWITRRDTRAHIITEDTHA